MKRLSYKRKHIGSKTSRKIALKTPEQKITRIQDVQEAKMNKVLNKGIAIEKAKSRKKNYKPSEQELFNKMIRREVAETIRSKRLSDINWSIPATTKEEAEIKIANKQEADKIRRKQLGIVPKLVYPKLGTPIKNRPETMAKRNKLKNSYLASLPNVLKMREKRKICKVIGNEIATAKQQLLELQTTISRLEYKIVGRHPNDNGYVRKNYITAIIRVIDGIEYISHEYRTVKPVNIKIMKKRLKELSRASLDLGATINRYSTIRKEEVLKNQKTMVGVYLFEGEKLTDDSICVYGIGAPIFNWKEKLQSYIGSTLGMIKTMGEEQNTIVKDLDFIPTTEEIKIAA